MDHHTEKAINEMDAAVMSGDGFHSIEGVERLVGACNRWLHAANTIAITLLEEPTAKEEDSDGV